MPQENDASSVGVAQQTQGPFANTTNLKGSLHRPLMPFFFSSLFPSPVELEQTPVKPLWLESCCQVIFKSS